MNRFSSHILATTLLMLAFAAPMTSGARAAAHLFNVTQTMYGGTLNLEAGTIVTFEPSCKLVGVTINGNNITVKPHGAEVAFENCTFNTTIVNSDVVATNFGLVGDMTTTTRDIVIKSRALRAGIRGGTDNTRAWLQLAQFLTNSRGVSVTFNGSFYNNQGTRFVHIYDARGLSLQGGTMIMGLRLVNCNDVSVNGISWVGYHEPHDFPPIYDKEPVTFNGIRYTTANSFKMKGDGLANIGIADDGIWAYVDTDGKTSSNLDIRHCHFEMRQGGIMIGTRSDKRITTNVTIDSCTMSHIAYQPLGFHASRCTATHITSDYCFQPIDISTCSNHVTVSDSRFTRCATGPKQETGTQFRSMLHDNAINRCYFEINDDYFMLDGSQFTLSIAEGAPGDVFHMSDCTFDVKKDRAFGGVRCRTSRAVLSNVTFNFDINLHPKSKSKWSMTEVFSVFGKSASNPHFDLNNVTINLSQGTKLNQLCFPHVAGVDMRFSASDLTVNGPGTINACFNTVKDLRLNRCALNARATTLFSGAKNTVSSLKDNTFNCRKIADSKLAPTVDQRANTIITTPR